MKKIKFLSMLFAIMMLFTAMPVSAHAQSNNLSTNPQYARMGVDENNAIQVIPITESEFLNLHLLRSGPFADGRAVYSKSGSLVAYVTLYYTTTTSGGMKVFVLDGSMTLGVNPQNGYAGSYDILSMTSHSVRIQYNYANMLGDSGYTTLVFYPQQ